MAGLPYHNFPAFLDCEAALVRGLTDTEVIINPARLFGSVSHADCMRRDLKAFLDAGVNILVRLPGWELSPGAVVENVVARSVGCAVYDYDNGQVIPALSPCREQNLKAVMTTLAGVVADGS